MFFSNFTEDQLSGWLRTIIREEIKSSLSEDEEKIVSPTEVTKMFVPNISVQTVINWTKQGKLKAYTNGGRKLLYKKSEVLATLKSIKRYSHAV